MPYAMDMLYYMMVIFLTMAIVFIFPAFMLYAMIMAFALIVFYYALDKARFPLGVLIFEPRQAGGMVVNRGRAGRRRARESGFEYVHFKGYKKPHNVSKTIEKDKLLSWEKRGNLGMYYHPNDADFVPMVVNADKLVVTDEDMRIVHAQVVDSIYRHFGSTNLLNVLVPLMAVGMVAAFVIVTLVVLPDVMENFLEGPLGEFSQQIGRLAGVTDKLATSIDATTQGTTLPQPPPE